MPWGSGQASSKTKKASTPKKKRQWSKVANSMKRQGASDAESIMAANAAVRDADADAQRRGR